MAPSYIDEVVAALRAGRRYHVPFTTALYPGAGTLRARTVRPGVMLAAAMTFDDVDAIAKKLPGVTVGTKWGNRTWMVGDKGFAWQRPFSKADLKRFGDETPPAGEILAVRVESLDAKDALLAMAPAGFFTIPHFNGYAAVLIALRAARSKDVRAAVMDAHAAMAAMVAPRPRKRR